MYTSLWNKKRLALFLAWTFPQSTSFPNPSVPQKRAWQYRTWLRIQLEFPKLNYRRSTFCSAVTLLVLNLAFFAIVQNTAQLKTRKNKSSRNLITIWKIQVTSNNMYRICIDKHNSLLVLPVRKLHAFCEVTLVCKDFIHFLFQFI